MVRQRTASADRDGVDARAAFLNVPYDGRFADLYLAFIAGITAFGLVPRAALEIAGGERRLDRIFQLIRTCRYSFHDLSRVELDEHRPATPRFNMPFELGLAVAWEKLHAEEHIWFVLETKNRRILKSLSDLAGTDIYVHGGRVKGIFRELGNALVREHDQPTVSEMQTIYRNLKNALPDVLRRAGTRGLFEARVFAELRVLALAFADREVARGLISSG